MTNSEAGSAKNTAALATSVDRPKRPRGIEAVNLARFSGVSALPMKVVRRGVSASAGLIAFTLILSGANSTAIDFVMRTTAPFDPLYHVSPGRGRTAAVEPMLMKGSGNLGLQWYPSGKMLCGTTKPIMP